MFLYSGQVLASRGMLINVATVRVDGNYYGNLMAAETHGQLSAFYSSVLDLQSVTWCRTDLALQSLTGRGIIVLENSLLLARELQVCGVRYYV
jgi:hypothetical protein